MKTFLAVIVFTCVSCLALNAAEDKTAPQKQKDCQTCPKKEMPASPAKMVCAAQDEKTPAPVAPKPAAKLVAKAEEENKDKTKEPKLASSAKEETAPAVAPKKEEAKKLVATSTKDCGCSSCPAPKGDDKTKPEKKETKIVA